MALPLREIQSVTHEQFTKHVNFLRSIECLKTHKTIRSLLKYKRLRPTMTHESWSKTCKNHINSRHLSGKNFSGECYLRQTNSVGADCKMSTITQFLRFANSTSEKQVGHWKIPYEHLADPRTQQWLLVSSVKPVLAWVALYLTMVLYLPKWLRSSKPLKLTPILIAYNLTMASLNFHIVKELLENAAHLNYNYLCQPCRVVFTKEEIKIASAVWWFYFSKLLEFSDTFFFIVRHKWKQLTPLHIYHHSTMFPLWWIAIKWVPTGSSFFPALINSFIHVIMYTYYGLSAFGPAIQKYLWWKKYLTGLQLVQFTIGLLWAIQALVRRCDFPVWINCATMIYMISFLILFGRFYRREYQKTNKHQKLL